MVPKNFGNVGRFWSSNITLKEAQTITIKGDYKRLQQIYKVMQETYRKERLEVWSKKSGKDYSFKEREFPGFTAWASSEMMAEIIQHELGKHEQQDRPGQSPGLPSENGPPKLVGGWGFSPGLPFFDHPCKILHHPSDGGIRTTAPWEGRK